MTEEELNQFLVGKVIVGIDTTFYMGEVALETIEFSDGSRIELDGRADMAHVWAATRPDGTQIPMRREL